MKPSGALWLFTTKNALDQFLDSVHFTEGSNFGSGTTQFLKKNLNPEVIPVYCPNMKVDFFEKQL